MLEVLGKINLAARRVCYFLVFLPIPFSLPSLSLSPRSEKVCTSGRGQWKDFKRFIEILIIFKFTMLKFRHAAQNKIYTVLFTIL